MRSVSFLSACVWFRDVTSFSDASGMVWVRVGTCFCIEASDSLLWLSFTVIFFIIFLVVTHHSKKLVIYPIALVFLYAFEESVDCHLLSSFCDDSNLHISLFQYVLSTMGVSKDRSANFNRKSISRKITHPQSWKLQAKLTGDKLKGWSNSREKTNSRLQSKFRNTSSKS